MRAEQRRLAALAEDERMRAEQRRLAAEEEHRMMAEFRRAAEDNRRRQEAERAQRQRPLSDVIETRIVTSARSTPYRTAEGTLTFTFEWTPPVEPAECHLDATTIQSAFAGIDVTQPHIVTSVIVTRVEANMSTRMTSCLVRIKDSRVFPKIDIDHGTWIGPKSIYILSEHDIHRARTRPSVDMRRELATVRYIRETGHWVVRRSSVLGALIAEMYPQLRSQREDICECAGGFDIDDSLYNRIVRSIENEVGPHTTTLVDVYANLGERWPTIMSHNQWPHRVAITMSITILHPEERARVWKPTTSP